jgi:hypothetical protein
MDSTATAARFQINGPIRHGTIFRIFFCSAYIGLYRFAARTAPQSLAEFINNEQGPFSSIPSTAPMRTGL